MSLSSWVLSLKLLHEQSFAMTGKPLAQFTILLAKNAQDWGDVSEQRDHPGSRKRRSGEELIEWTPIQQSQLKKASCQLLVFCANSTALLAVHWAGEHCASVCLHGQDRTEV